MKFPTARLDRSFYQDPALSVRFERERARKGAADGCAAHQNVAGCVASPAEVGAAVQSVADALKPVKGGI